MNRPLSKRSLQSVLSLLVGLIALLQTGCQSSHGDGDIEAALYRLGSYPVAKLTHSHWTNGNGGKVFSKGKRIDHDGWLPPYWAATDRYLSAEERKAAGIPQPRLSDAEYLAPLDVKGYRRNRSPLRLTVMRFALDEISRHEIAASNSESILAVYRSDIGLEKEALRAVKRSLAPA
ncbi:MAG: hypothetical protein ACI8W8_001023, partial [Rhodothermales bacterium]